MKKVNLLVTRLLVLNLMLFSYLASAQTPKQLQEITATYNNFYLQELATQSLESSKTKKTQAIQYASVRNIPVTYTTETGGFAELQEVLADGTLIYYQTYNADAAKSTRVDHLNTGGSTGYNLDGQNMTAYVWDAGHARESHQEYHGAGGNDRITNMDISEEGGLDLDSHAAHVVGTIGASGFQPQAKGMAPHSKVKAYKWNNDLSEAASAAANGMLVSNHSYGNVSENLDSNYFGAYMYSSRSWDDLMFNASYFLMVKAAGNDGNKLFYNTQPLMSGYDILSGASTSKNNLVVAAANDANIDSNGNLISVTIGSFSSPGPTDDLRIKPDIAGNGVGVYSTYETSNDDYASIQGTSMASPNVTGSLLLLQQHYNNVNDSFMRAATLKGLALHTADDAGPTGPDAVWGWGLLNAKKAAETITQNGTESLIHEMVLLQGQTITMEVDSDGLNDLIASISWTDRAGNVNTQLNSPTPILVNDLDIRVSKNETTHYPWRLTSASTNSNEGDNSVDPFERIEIEDASGTYTITISHKGTLVGGSQAFSLIVTGLQVECVASIPANVNTLEVSGTSASILWTPISGSIYDLRYREVESSQWTNILDITNNTYEITDLDVFTEYEIEVRSKCDDGGEPSEYSSAVTFSTSGLDYCDSYSNNARADYHISNVSLNTINNTSTESTYSDFTNIGTELIAGDTYTISISTGADANYSVYYSVWIDYNGNGVFDSEELVANIWNTALNTATSTFTVPSNISPLSTTMRVSLSSSSYPGPCNIGNIGEVEDYAIHIRSFECVATIPQNVEADIIGTTASFTWSPISNVTYDFRYREVGTSMWTIAFDLSDANFDIENLDAHTEYEASVRSQCSQGEPSEYSDSFIFNTSGYIYCESYSQNAFNNYYISNVNLNEIDNNSVASTYSDFTNLSTELVVGETYTISLTTTADSNYLTYYSVWIDYNGNGVFDTEERVFSMQSSADYVSTGTFTVPSNISPLTTIMRVSLDSSRDPEPCDVNIIGEVEDYTINIILQECVALIPDDVNIQDITQTTASVSWSSNPYSEYDLRYREVGIDSWTTVSDIPTNEYEITELESSTEYEVQVRSKCSEGNTSEYSTSVTFTTEEVSYCDSYSYVPLDYFYISNVNLNTIDNNSDYSAYSDFTNISTDLVPGETYTISLTTTADADYDTSYVVWIDYNNDRIFNESEVVFSIRNTAFNIATGSFTVPMDINPVTTRMRVSMSNGTTPNPCEVFDYGEVEDYTIHIQEPNVNFVYENNAWSPFSPEGVSTDQDNIIIINGNTSFTTNIVAKDVTINSGASLAIEKVLTISGDLTNNGQLVFVSSSTGNGELGPVSESSTISGNITVQRYMKNRRSYRMVSSAVTTTNSIHNNWQEGAISNSHNPNVGFGTHITGATTDQANGFDGTATGNPSMFTVNVPAQQFEAVSNTDTNTLTAGDPYLLFVRGDRSIDLNNNNASSETVLRATGSLFTGTKTQNFANASADNFVMFGNPYQSAIDINSVFAASTNLITRYYYVYDPNLGAHGSYVTIDLLNGSNTAGSSANQYLQPGQAAQVKVSGPATVVFNENDKAPGNFTSSNRNSMSSNNMLTVQLYTTTNFNNGGPLHDSFGILFDESYDNRLTYDDATKPMNFHENIGVDHNGTYLSIEQREMPQPDEVYPLYSAGYQQTEYTLKMTVNGLEETLLYLDDRFTGISTPLETGDNTYEFSVDSNNALSISTDRFSIRTEARLGVNENDLLSNIRLFPNPLNGDIFYINSPKLDGKQISVSIKDLTGRNIYQQTLECSANTIIVPMGDNISSGVYLVTLKHRGDSQTYRLIKE